MRADRCGSKRRVAGGWWLAADQPAATTRSGHSRVQHRSDRRPGLHQPHTPAMARRVVSVQAMAACRRHPEHRLADAAFVHRVAGPLARVVLGAAHLGDGQARPPGSGGSGGCARPASSVAGLAAARPSSQPGGVAPGDRGRVVGLDRPAPGRVVQGHHHRAVPSGRIPGQLGPGRRRRTRSPPAVAVGQGTVAEDQPHAGQVPGARGSRLMDSPHGRHDRHGSRSDPLTSWLPRITSTGTEAACSRSTTSVELLGGSPSWVMSPLATSSSAPHASASAMAARAQRIG